jgi:hypothetical protein
MRRYTSRWSERGAVIRAALLVAVAIGACGCAAGSSAVATSTYGKASVYRSATAYVELAPEDAFEPAVGLLLEREDIEITDLKEAENSCTAVAENRRLTLRVIESTPGRSRLSVMVGGGNDGDANDLLAKDLLVAICGRLRSACE